MATPVRDISHDHGILKEVYEVTARYAEVCKRLRGIGTDQDSISEDFYRAAVKLYADALLFPDTLTQLSDADRRDSLINLATLVLRWARKIRVGTPPGMPHPVMPDGIVPNEP